MSLLGKVAPGEDPKGKRGEVNKAKAEARQVRVLWELTQPHCTERGGGHFRTLPKITRRLKSFIS